MLGIGKYAQSWFYIEYSIQSPILSLWINGCQLFKNFMRDATHNNSFGLGSAYTNEVRKHIYYSLDDIFVFFYELDLRIEDLTESENMTQ